MIIRETGQEKSMMGMICETGISDKPGKKSKRKEMKGKDEVKI